MGKEQIIKINRIETKKAKGHKNIRYTIAVQTLGLLQSNESFNRNFLIESALFVRIIKVLRNIRGIQDFKSRPHITKCCRSYILYGKILQKIRSTCNFIKIQTLRVLKRKRTKQKPYHLVLPQILLCCKGKNQENLH